MRDWRYMKVWMMVEVEAGLEVTGVGCRASVRQKEVEEEEEVLE